MEVIGGVERRTVGSVVVLWMEGWSSEAGGGVKAPPLCHRCE